MYDLDIIRKDIEKLPHVDLLFYPEIGSTNTAGMMALENNPSEGNLLILAQVQTAGRGRFNRQWLSDPEDSLTFSLVLRNLADLPIEKLGLLPLLGALSAVEAIQQTCPVPPDSTIKNKWPNDLLINSRKTCGILSEASWDNHRLRGVVLGMGINVGLGSVPSAEFLNYPATSIEGEFGWKPPRETMLIAVLASFFQWLPLLATEEFRMLYQNHLAFMGESVNIFNEAGKHSMTGIIQGISDHGDLVLLQEDNKTILCSAGEITVRTA